jgi:hypothetical protein
VNEPQQAHELIGLAIELGQVLVIFAPQPVEVPGLADQAGQLAVEQMPRPEDLTRRPVATSFTLCAIPAPSHGMVYGDEDGER